MILVSEGENSAQGAVWLGACKDLYAGCNRLIGGLCRGDWLWGGELDSLCGETPATMATPATSSMVATCDAAKPLRPLCWSPTLSHCLYVRWMAVTYVSEMQLELSFTCRR
jgi:hypothetical protein